LIRPKINKITSLAFVYVLWILNSLMVILSLLELYDLVSGFFYASFFFVLFLFISRLLTSTFSKHEKINLSILVIIIVFSFINITISNISSSGFISFQYYKKFIMFSSTLIYFFIITKIKPTKRFVNFVLSSSVLLALVLMYYTFFQNLPRITDSLTLNFSNPNAAAVYLFGINIYVYLSFIKIKNLLIKTALLAVYFLMSYAIYDTNSRAVFIAIIVFFFMAIFLKSKKPFNRVFIILIILIPIIFVGIYMLMYKRNIIIDLELFGKDFYSVRIKMWEQLLNLASKKPVTGIYYHIGGPRGLSQLHNIYIDTICSYGYPVFILLIIYLYRVFINANTYINTTIQKISFIAILSFIIWGTGEAALFTGFLGLYIFAGTLLIFVKHPLTDRMGLKDPECLEMTTKMRTEEHII